MRNLFVLLLRYNAFLLFIVLQTISLSLVFSSNSFQRAVLRDNTQQLVGGTQNAYNGVVQYFRLPEINDSLSNQLAELTVLLERQGIAKDTTTVVTDGLPAYYQLIPAKLISNSVHRRNNYITLNVGTYDGVKKNMAVISHRGVVGIIKGVSGNFASGISLLNSEFSVSARVKELNENGALVWNGEDYRYASLQNIPSHVNLKKGQKVEVNSFSFIFPESTPIGEIESFDSEAGEAFYNIKVRLYEDLKNLGYVYVVNNRQLEEKEALEKAVVD